MANVNYRALFLFIDAAREPRSHRVSVIKNVFLMWLFISRERNLKGLKLQKEKRGEKFRGKTDGREIKS